MAYRPRTPRCLLALAVLLTRALGQAQQAPPATPTFADVPADYWAYE